MGRLIHLNAAKTHNLPMSMITQAIPIQRGLNLDGNRISSPSRGEWVTPATAKLGKVRG